MIPVNPYTIIAAITVIGWIFRINLSVNVAGAVTVSMFLPVAVAVALAVAIAVLVFLIVRSLSGGRLVRSTA
jgi:hypothetical protein